MTQAMALGSGSEDLDGRVSLVAGHAPESLPGQDNEMRIVSLVGDPMDWEGTRDQFPRFVRSGGYEMRIGEKRYGLSVRASAGEGSREFVSGDRVPAMGRVEHRIVALNDDSELKDLLAASRTGVNLYLPLLLAIVAMMAEGLLGSPRQQTMLQPGPKRIGAES